LRRHGAAAAARAGRDHDDAGPREDPGGAQRRRRALLPPAHRPDGAAGRPGGGDRAVGPGVGGAGVGRHAGAAAGPARPGTATRRRRAVLPTRSGPPTVAGRWWLLPEPASDATQRAQAQAEVLLERHGVVTRGAVTAERLPGGFSPIYQVLRAYEESGRCRR